MLRGVGERAGGAVEGGGRGGVHVAGHRGLLAGGAVAGPVAATAVGCGVSTGALGAEEGRQPLVGHGLLGGFAELVALRGSLARAVDVRGVDEVGSSELPDIVPAEGHVLRNIEPGMKSAGRRDDEFFWDERTRNPDSPPIVAGLSYRCRRSRDPRELMFAGPAPRRGWAADGAGHQELVNGYPSS